MTAGELTEWVTLEDTGDRETPIVYHPDRVAAAVIAGPPSSFDEQKNTYTVWLRYHPQVTTDTRVRWRGWRESTERHLFVRGIRDDRNTWLELLCEEVRTP